MLSESARAASSAEARYRIDAPNSRQRAVKVIALDRTSEAVVQRLSRASWNSATFFTASAFAAATQNDERFSMQGWLSDLAGRTKDLVDEIETADLVVMVATAGEDASAASLIGEACSAKRIMTTALVVGADEIPDDVLAQTLSKLRPWALMLVIAGSEEYIADMLTALRA
ncbi:MAG TPA: hypothetical protein VE224_05175 [Pseudolabrys sp.]|nr:hypothetical protein [Pseudolabrys sp.]